MATLTQLNAAISRFSVCLGEKLTVVRKRTDNLYAWVKTDTSNNMCIWAVEEDFDPDIPAPDQESIDNGSNGTLDVVAIPL